MSCLKLLEQLLEQQLDSSSKDTLARKNVAKKLEKMLLEATLGFEGETRCHWLSSLDEVRLLPGDSLVTCRIDAVKRALQDQPCPSLKSLKSGEEQTKLLSKSVSKMLNNFVVPTVLDDDSADSIAAHLSQSEARSYHGTLLAIQATEDGNHKGFIYSRRISRKLSKRSTLVCNLDTAYTVADASLAFPVHPGDQIQFKLNTCKQQNEIDVFDIVVTDYYSLNDKEITSYIDDLEKCSKSTESDFTDPLLKVTNFLPMWKYIMNARQLPENVSRKVVVLHNCIVKSRTSQLQQSRMETLMRSYIGAKFLDNLYDQVGKEVDLADVCEFLSSFVKYLPTSAFAVVRLISRLTELLNQSGQMETSCKFLMEVVTTTCVPPRTTSISSLRWDQTPLIVTPQELSVLTQAGGGKHAHLPVVQTKGPYESLNAYYNTYFRLLREDCFGEACRLIGAAKLGQLNEDTDVVYHVSGFTGLHFLRNGRGMAYGVKIEPSSDIDWTTSDVLKSENLVCLSIDGKFEDEKMIWATIATQNGSRIANLQKGELFVQFCTEANERSDAEVILLLRDSKHAVMVESPTFFRAYYPVLKSLQQRKIEETPFQDELLRFQSSAVGLIDPNSKLDWKVIFKPKNSSEEMPYTTVGELDAVTKDHNFECLLDDSQLDALKLACSQPLTIIQGPPGTGKSYIGVKLVQLFRTIGALSIAKKPILILTYKNRVLDQFLEDCLQFCPLGKIVRVGKVGSRKLESRGLTAVLHREKLKHRRYARRIHYDSISRLKTLKHELHRAGRQLELSDCLNVDMIMSRATTEQLQSLLYGDEDITEEDSEILSKLRFKDNADLKELKRNKDFKQLVTRSADRWIGKALQQSPEESKEEKKARMPSLFRAQGSKSATRQSEDKDSDLSSELFQGKTLEQERLWSIDDEEPNVYGEKKVDEGPQSISFNYESSQEWKINISKQRSPENVQPRLANCTDVWILDPDERRLLAQSWLGRQCKAAADQFTSAAKEYDDICEHIQDRNRLIKFEILKSVDIVGMTTTGAAIHQQLLTAVEPAVVIVEEACEVLEAQLLATLTSSVKHLIMIGDHAQLRPKVACHWLSQHHHFDRSMFERLVSNQFPHKTLQNQRRMREEFTELLKPYYSYLQSHSQVKEIRIPKCFGSYHMFFWSYEKEYEKKRVSGTIIVNEKEVLMVVTLVLALLICGELSESITALSPYRAQVHAIIERLQNCRDLCSDEDVITKAKDVKVCTVDEYQGYENDIIILSLVRSNKANKLGFLKEKNRVVVSISRQRSSLIVIGNSQFLERNDSNWKAIIKKFHDRGCHGTQLTLQMNKSEPAVNVYEVVRRAIAKPKVTATTSSCEMPSELQANIEHSSLDDHYSAEGGVDETTESTKKNSKLSVVLKKSNSNGSNDTSQDEQLLQSPLSPLTPTSRILSKTMQRVAWKVGKSWIPLCRELGLEDNEIETIKANDPLDAQEQAHQGLLKWSRSQGDRANKEALIAACSRPEVDRKDVASDLEKGLFDF